MLRDLRRTKRQPTRRGLFLEETWRPSVASERGRSAGPQAVVDGRLIRKRARLLRTSASFLLMRGVQHRRA
jgi:hypothetical protein